MVSVNAGRRPRRTRRRLAHKAAQLTQPVGAPAELAAGDELNGAVLRVLQRGGFDVEAQPLETGFGGSKSAGRVLACQVASR